MFFWVSLLGLWRAYWHTQFSDTARRILKIFEGCFPIQSVQFLVDQHGKMIEKGWNINMPRLSRFEPPPSLQGLSELLL